MTKKWLIIGGSALAALLVVVIVLLVVVIGQNNASAKQAEHDRRVAICESIHGPIAENTDAVVNCLADLTD